MIQVIWLVIIASAIAIDVIAQRDCSVFGTRRKHGQKWLADGWQFKCHNGLFDISGCVTSKSANSSVVPVNTTQVINKLWRNCTQRDSVFKYQEGVQCDHSDFYRSGHFQLRCNETGRYISGCYFKTPDGKWDTLKIGEHRVVGARNHTCFRNADKPGRIHYSAHSVGCVYQNNDYKYGETWKSDNFILKCRQKEGIQVEGCLAPDGTSVPLNENYISKGVLHRCEKVNDVTVYKQNPVTPCKFQLGPFLIHCRSTQDANSTSLKVI